MRLKLLILMLLIITALLWWFYYKPNVTPQKLPATVKQPKLNVAKKLTENIQKPQPKSITEQPNQSTDSIDIGTEKWEQQLISQLSDLRYSEDVVVELMSIGFEFEGCGNQNTEWFFQNRTLSNRQTNLKLTAEIRCAQLAKKYPFLIDKNLNISKIKQETFPATTALGQYLQKRYPPDSQIDVFQHQQNLITLALKAGNAQMLMSAKLANSFGVQDLNLAKTILGSSHKQYFKTINSIALISLSCQFNDGITCLPSAKFMAYKCYAQDHFCGLNFQQWYEQAVTAGVARDVDLLKQHYLSAAGL